MNVLKFKHWQIYLFLIIAQLVGSVNLEDMPTVTSVLKVVSICTLLLWPISTGYELNELLPRRLQLNSTLFVINSFLLLATLVAFLLLFEGETYTANGLAALPIFYLFYAYYQIHSFPAKVLKTAQLGRKAQAGDYLGDMFLFLFWPIGIWVLQPKINKAVEKIELAELIKDNRTSHIPN